MHDICHLRETVLSCKRNILYSNTIRLVANSVFAFRNPLPLFYIFSPTHPLFFTILQLCLFTKTHNYPFSLSTVIVVYKLSLVISVITAMLLTGGDEGHTLYTAYVSYNMFLQDILRTGLGCLIKSFTAVGTSTIGLVHVITCDVSVFFYANSIFITVAILKPSISVIEHRPGLFFP
jgi:hypothetical protein